MSPGDSRDFDTCFLLHHFYLENPYVTFLSYIQIRFYKETGYRDIFVVLLQRLPFSKAVVLIYIHGNNNVYTMYMGKEITINFGLYFSEFGSIKR